MSMVINEIHNKIFSSNAINLDDQVIWLVNVLDFYKYIDIIKQFLSEEEIKKSEFIKFEKNKYLFYLRKGIRRIILGRKLDVEPNEIEYYYNIYGKPFILDSSCKRLDFNISHSKEYLLIGMSGNGDIGVDIEKINRSLNADIFASSIFSNKEMMEYNGYDNSNKLWAFYKVWVQKEAISKALGIGLSIGFNNFSVNIDPNSNGEVYSLYLDDLKKFIKMSVRLENDYVLATALCQKTD